MEHAQVRDELRTEYAKVAERLKGLLSYPVARDSAEKRGRPAEFLCDVHRNAEANMNSAFPGMHVD